MKLPPRFWTKVDKRGPISKLGTRCWIWTVSLKGNDYGQFMLNGKNKTAHILAWEEVHGTVPPHHELHHRCDVRKCVRPSHIEPLTRRAHLFIGPERCPISRQMRQDKCKRGHLLNLQNTYSIPRGTYQDGTPKLSRVCRICHRARQRNFQNKMRGGRVGADRASIGG